MQELLLMPRTSLSGQVNFRLAAPDMERLDTMARAKGIATSAMAKELMLKAMNGLVLPTKEEIEADFAQIVLTRLTAMEAELEAMRKRRKP